MNKLKSDYYMIRKTDVNKKLEKLVTELNAIHELKMQQKRTPEQTIDAIVNLGTITTICELFGIDEDEVLKDLLY